MSSFSGKIKEFPQISIDRFDGRNLASTAYFLSHAHSDHMIGLSSPQFLDHLESNSGVYLYCSPITARFLQASIRHRPLTPFICPLQPEESVKITVPNVAEEATHQLWVTLIPAAHCPGSVMFLFEGRGGTALYTGDFRISGEEAARLSSLHNQDGTVKLIDSLHIDTTFCHRDVMHFPSREESAQAVAELVEDWLARGNNFLIHLVCSARYGYEYIYRSLHERFGRKIHVSRWKYQMYDTVPEIQDMLTLDATITWIHACDWRMKTENTDVQSLANRQLPCRCVPFGVDTEPNIRVIKPSAQFYTMYQSAKEIKQLNQDGTFCRVLLSMHASCSEVLDLVSYLRPRKVFPNVIPSNSSKEEVLKLLHEALNRSGDHYSIEYGGSQRPTMGSFKRQLLSGDRENNFGLFSGSMLDVYFSSSSKKRRHSDSNMALVLPAHRGNMKGSLSLEGESRQHSQCLQPWPTSPTPTRCPKLALSDSEAESLEWKDPYSPSPTKCNDQFFPSSRKSVTKQSSGGIKKSLCESVSIEGNNDANNSDTIEENSTCHKDLFGCGNVDADIKKRDSRESVSSALSEEGDTVFEEDSRFNSSVAESPMKRSRKLWYKHKYFSTPIHDEMDRAQYSTGKLSIGPRSCSLPLPAFNHETLVVSPDICVSPKDENDDDDDRNLPLITVSSPSDQVSESQVSDETNITVVLSSGETSDCDALHNEEIDRDIVVLSDSNDGSNVDNNDEGFRPSVIRSPPGTDVSDTSVGGDCVTFLKGRLKRHHESAEWIDCTNKSKVMGKNNRNSVKRIRRVALNGGDPLRCPEVIGNKSYDDLTPSSRSSCLKTTRRTQDRVEVISFDHVPLSPTTT